MEAALPDREPAAVHDTVDAESETILVSEGAVVLNEKPEETPPHTTQSDQGQPDSLHLVTPVGNGFMEL